MIHLGTHEHLITEGMCREALEEIKLVEGQVSRTPDTKISTITLNANKAFLAHHLFNKNGEEHVEILKGEKLNEVMESSNPSILPTFGTSLHLLNIVLVFEAP